MYRVLPLRALRRTTGIIFDEIVPSDIPKISGIDRVIHSANGISPGPVGPISTLILFIILPLCSTLNFWELS